MESDNEKIYLTQPFISRLSAIFLLAVFLLCTIYHLGYYFYYGWDYEDISLFVLFLIIDLRLIINLFYQRTIEVKNGFVVYSVFPLLKRKFQMNNLYVATANKNSLNIFEKIWYHCFENKNLYTLETDYQRAYVNCKNDSDVQKMEEIIKMIKSYAGEA